MTICSNCGLLATHSWEGKILAFLCGPSLAFCDSNLKFWPQIVVRASWEQAAWKHENPRYANLARRCLSSSTGKWVGWFVYDSFISAFCQNPTFNWQRKYTWGQVCYRESSFHGVPIYNLSQWTQFLWFDVGFCCWHGTVIVFLAGVWQGWGVIYGKVGILSPSVVDTGAWGEGSSIG